jgi:hypothetical protein
MAFVGATARLLFRSAVAILQSARTAITEGQLAQRLINIHGQIGRQPFASYQAIARQARRTATTAVAMGSSPAQTFGVADLPVDPSIGRTDPRFNYRILVTVENASTGGQVKYAIDVQSDQAQSLASLTQQAQERFSPWASRQSTRRAIRQLGSNVAVSVEVLSAGKRG